MYIESNSGGTSKVIVDNTQSCAQYSVPMHNYSSCTLLALRNNARADELMFIRLAIQTISFSFKKPSALRSAPSKRARTQLRTPWSRKILYCSVVPIACLKR